MEQQNYTVAEVGTALQSLNRIRTKMLLFMVLCVAVFLLGFLALGILSVLGILIFIAGIVGFFICLRKYSKIGKQMKELVGSTLVRSALEDVFEQVSYDMEGRLPDHIIRNTDMDFPFDFDEIKGSDHIRAVYQGLQIEMSDIELIDVQRHVDSKGHVEEDRTTVFKGIWMICDFGKELSADLLLRERTSKISKFTRKIFRSKDEVQTENEAFNEKFVIRSESEHDVFYILTPHMMEYILKMDEKGEGDTYLRFQRGGKVHIAVNSDKDFFEMKGELDAERLRARFISEVKYITDLIDELRLVDTLFKA